MRIGVDIGGTTVKAGVLDEQNNIIARSVVKTVKQRGFEGMIEDIASAAITAAQKAQVPLEAFPSIGFGCPGMIDLTTGVVIHAGNLGWTNCPARDALQKYFPCDVYLGNDANCAVAGELVAGAAKGYENVLMITLGTGVGGGIIMNGKIVTGGKGLGTELGHIKLVYGGEHCTCGMDGCWEAYASITALIRDAERARKDHPESMLNSGAGEDGYLNGKIICDCVDAGDPTAVAVMEQYEEWVAAGTGSLISIFRPDIVLFGGGISAQGEKILNPIRERAKGHTFAGHVLELPPFQEAVLGNDAGIIGAAWLDVLQ